MSKKSSKNQRSAPAKADPVAASDANEGEGSRTAARAYDAHASETARNLKKVQELAGKAARALEGQRGKELREAEARGKRAQHR
jgi:hypothetical protein